MRFSDSHGPPNTFNGDDGSLPRAGLTFDAAGNLYGITATAVALGDAISPETVGRSSSLPNQHVLRFIGWAIHHLPPGNTNLRNEIAPVSVASRMLSSPNLASKCLMQAHQCAHLQRSTVTRDRFYCRRKVCRSVYDEPPQWCGPHVRLAGRVPPK